MTTLKEQYQRTCRFLADAEDEAESVIIEDGEFNTEMRIRVVLEAVGEDGVEELDSTSLSYTDDSIFEGVKTISKFRAICKSHGIATE